MKSADSSHAEKQPLVSIVVPTYNRSRMLEAALNSLAGLHTPKDRYEVIVVDDQSSDNTAEVVRRFMSQGSFRLIYLRQAHAGVTAARNRGIRAARGEFLVFTDDDCTFPSNWLNALLKAADSPAVGAVGGPDQAPPDSSLFARSVDYALTSFIGTGGVRAGRGRSLARYYPRGCNFLVTRTALEKVGGFDPTLTAGEEIELGYRIRRAGYALRYAPDALVHHHRRDTWRAFARQMYARGLTRPQLIRRHAGLFEWSYLIPSLLVMGSLATIPFTMSPAGVSRLWTPCAIAYFLLLVLGAVDGTVKMRDARAGWLLPILVLMQHLLYGIGFLVGVLAPPAAIPGYR